MNRRVGRAVHAKKEMVFVIHREMGGGDCGRLNTKCGRTQAGGGTARNGTLVLTFGLEIAAAADAPLRAVL